MSTSIKLTNQTGIRRRR